MTGGCSLLENLVVERGSLEDYRELERFHYRGGRPRCVSDVFRIVEKNRERSRFGSVVGVIVYSMPLANVRMRNIATDGFFSRVGDKSLGLQMLNQYVRCISRVVIDPRYRGLGLSVRLVRESIEMVDVCMVEALAVMGRFNPFFEKAGMCRFDPVLSESDVVVREALLAVGIDVDGGEGIDEMFFRYGELAEGERLFVDEKIRRVKIRGGVVSEEERLRRVLGRLGSWPSYFLYLKQGSNLDLC